MPPCQSQLYSGSTFDLPAQPLVLSQVKAFTAFTQLPPTESLNAVSFKSRPIPLDDYVKKLWAALKVAATWLKSAMGQEFRIEGRSLACGSQKDTFSCGICPVNAIAHHVLGEAGASPARVLPATRKESDRICMLLLLGCLVAVLHTQQPCAGQSAVI